MTEIKYQYAYDEDNNLVSINDYTKEDSKCHSYRCVGCGRVLLPRAIGSRCRRAHFYHKEEVVCNSETYLHNLGKSLIRRKFETSDSFTVSYPVTKECNNKSCSLRNSNCRQDRQMETFDLKKYYDTCREEVSINGFVADLLLTNSQKSNIPPILIEIHVTHQCEEKKKTSGLKIIELTFNEEQDVFDLVAKDVIEEPIFSPVKGKKVKFISFKRNAEISMECNISRFVFNPAIRDNGYITQISCKNAAYKLLKNSVVELNFVSDGDDAIFIPLVWMYKYKFLRRCSICKFYYAMGGYEDTSICRLSRKYGKPRYPKMTDAEQCRSFSFKDDHFFRSYTSNRYVEEVVNLPKELKDEYRVIIAGSSSFDDYDLFKAKCDHYLSSKRDSHFITILCGTSANTEYFIHKYGQENSINIERYEAEWGKYGQGAGYKSNNEMVAHADALIAFWDGKGRMTGSLIGAAKAKGLKVAVVNYKVSTENYFFDE